MYEVYALYNKDSDKIYIGQTENLEVRFKLHKDKAFIKGYTAKNDGSWELVYRETVNSRKDALKREKQLKSYRGREFIRKTIQEKHIPA